MTALIVLAVGVLILVVGTIYVVVRPRSNQWRASDQEQLPTWLGDKLVAEPSWTVMAVVHRPKPTSVCQPRHTPVAQTSIELYWLPLGAGGWFVRLNGRIYEAIHARLERRQPLDLYHTALVVHLPEARFVVENCWPIPDLDGRSRGVAVQGPVASRRLARFRVFRYEVRRWRDGVIADAGEAVASPQLLSDDPATARRLLDLVGCLPSPVWGRDELGTGEMWNSNSVIAWLLASSGLAADAICPPAWGTGPGMAGGVVTASTVDPRSRQPTGRGLLHSGLARRYREASCPVQQG